MSNSSTQDQHQNSGGGGGGGGQQTKKKRLIDKVCASKIFEIVPESNAYHDMFMLERKLDFKIATKTLDIQEALKRPARVKKTLRIFISNLFYTHQDTGAPSWELRIEGRLTEDSRSQKRKFSSFIKNLVIELDSNIYGPDNHLIEWNRTPTITETDGFHIRRGGDLPVDCIILFQLEHQPRQYKIDKRLARLLGKRTDTRPAIIYALWQYIKNKSLQDQNDREYINNDKYLKSIFECKRMKLSEIPQKMNHLLSPPDPIVINHSIIRGIGETQRSIYEIDVEVEENPKDSMGATMMSTANLQEVQQLDEKICDTLESIKLTRSSFDLYTSFAKDPHRFTSRWLAAHSSDLSKMATKSTATTTTTTTTNSTSTPPSTTTNSSNALNATLDDTTEEERRAEYYYQPELQGAVCKYFYRKIQESRGELYSNMLD